MTFLKLFSRLDQKSISTINQNVYNTSYKHVSFFLCFYYAQVALSNFDLGKVITRTVASLDTKLTNIKKYKDCKIVLKPWELVYLFKKQNGPTTKAFFQDDNERFPKTQFKILFSMLQLLMQI